MYLFDTDVLIWILRGNKTITEKASLLKNKSSIGISTISIAEIYKNIFPSEIPITENFLKQHITFHVTEDIAKQAGLYWQEYSKKLNALSLTDCLIAATACINDAKLVTLNGKHFPMKNISVLDPTK